MLAFGKYFLMQKHVKRITVVTGGIGLSCQSATLIEIIGLNFKM